MISNSKLRVCQNFCTKDCSSNCGIISSVDSSGRLVKIEANPAQRYTNRFLCCKGYNYINYVYHPLRILHPWIQKPRYSGKWYKASWNEVLDIISQKIIQTRTSKDSLLSLAFMRGNGRHGALTNILESMLNSLGPISKISTVGALCSAVRPDAQILDFGHILDADPEDMIHAKLVFLWGINPAATAIHQIPLLNKVRQNGGKIVLIDIIPSLSTTFSDIYVQVKPGGDGALALLIIKRLLLRNKINYAYVSRNTIGWSSFVDYLLSVEEPELQEVAGILPHVTEKLVALIDENSPLAIWAGGGLLRYSNSGQNVRAIHALSAVTSSLKKTGGGIFASRSKQPSHYNANFAKPASIYSGLNRNIYIDSLGENILASDPPVKFLWINGVNPLVSVSNPHSIRRAFQQIEFIVTTEHFFTATARASDIVLPGTTFFESWDIVDSYFHLWMGINQKAIEPLGECRSDVAIASELCKKLCTARPNISNFPFDLTEIDWLKDEIPKELYQQLGIEGFEELLSSPRKLRLSYKNDEKYRFQSENAKKDVLPAMPVYIKGKSPSENFPFRLIFTRKAEFHNTQLLPEIATSKNTCHINRKIAKQKKLQNGDRIRIYNDHASLAFVAALVDWVPENVVHVQSFLDINGRSINELTSVQKTDMGMMTFGAPGIAFHDTFVNIAKESF